MGSLESTDINKNERSKKQIVSYWGKRSSGFLQQRRRELESPMAGRWLKEITAKIPSGKKLNILDVGCGTGFFSILLAKLGHKVTGIDLTPDMIRNARLLAGENHARCDFLVMDGENLKFADDSFDLVISRNLTWTLPDTKHAYGEWMRVLKKDGILVNFDADYGVCDCTQKEGLPQNHAHNQVDEAMLEECERIKKQLPISRCKRPAWDVNVLKSMGARKISTDLNFGRRIYIEKDEFYNPAPLFSLVAVK